MSLYRSGNMSLSMLWSVLKSSRGIDGRGNDDREKDVVPKIFRILVKFSDFKKFHHSCQIVFS